MNYLKSVTKTMLVQFVILVVMAVAMYQVVPLEPQEVIPVLESAPMPSESINETPVPVQVPPPEGPCKLFLISASTSESDETLIFMISCSKMNHSHFYNVDLIQIAGRDPVRVSVILQPTKWHRASRELIFEQLVVLMWDDRTRLVLNTDGSTCTDAIRSPSAEYAKLAWDRWGDAMRVMDSEFRPVDCVVHSLANDGFPQLIWPDCEVARDWKDYALKDYATFNSTFDARPEELRGIFAWKRPVSA